MTPEKSLIIPAGLRDAIVKYMSEQPYKDVAAAIPALMALKTFETPPESKPE